MVHLVAWCGFFGAWLLVAGPLDQALRELDEEDFERDAFARAKREVEIPPPVSRWWLALPPIYYVLRRRRDDLYKRRVAAALSPTELAAFTHLRDVASAWIYVAGGASLIAIKETWDLHESYEWSEWTFWVLVLVMLVLCRASTATRLRRRRRVQEAGSSAPDGDSQT